jgi:hypothetical protein
MTTFKRVPPLAAVVASTFCLAWSGPVLAVDQLGLFELDGNATSDGFADDWSDLHTGGGDADTFTGINADPPPLTIFTGGRKDIQPISEWSHKSGSSADKAEITNAYAAAYNEGGDLIVYFGADRFSNNGDTFLGFWFFKQSITALPDGTFDGEHEQDDTLVLANFPQATNAVPNIQVLTWDTSCSKADNNNPQPGQCAAKNLRLKYGGSGPGAVCSPGVDPQLACAITNEENGPNDPTDSPWPYTSKDGFVNQFPYETFFEGGVNLTQLLGGSGGACFASFMAESRASSSPTASLMDFVLDSFPVCAISVTKQCSGGTLNAAQTHITYDVTGTVTNDGFGTIHDVNVSDVPAFDAGSLQWSANPATLAGQSSINYSATITVPLANNGFINTVTATANTAAGGTGTELSDTAQSTCPQIQVNPAASVTKQCWSTVAIENNTVVAKVNVSGTVCNTGDSNLTNVSVVDNKAGTLLSSASLVAPADPANPGDTPGACQNYSGNYTPDAALDLNDDPTTDPTAVVFKDTVTVSATDIFGQALSPQPTAQATCPLCDCDDCE